MKLLKNEHFIHDKFSLTNFVFTVNKFSLAHIVISQALNNHAQQQKIAGTTTEYPANEVHDIHPIVFIVYMPRSFKDWLHESYLLGIL